jgi:hypothetical protein
VDRSSLAARSFRRQRENSFLTNPSLLKRK